MRKSTLLWVVAVMIAAAVSAGLTAQVVQPTPADQPRVLFGDDIGFRVDGPRRETRTDRQTGRTGPVTIVTGQLMVKVNGQWMEAEVTTGGRVRPATN